MRIHLIPNSHIDPVWLWDKYEGIDEVLSTFRTACDLLDEHPSLTFTASSIQFYEWVLRHDPALFARIQAWVEAGRWEVVGCWWVESDTNLPTWESFRYQAEISQRFCAEHFGSRSRVVYLPDTFGHPADLPTVLRDTGFEYFLFSRPGIHEKPDLPANLFHWEHEGARVLAYRLKFHYSQGRDPSAARLAEVLADAEFREHPASCFFFGVGDHGGGPTRREIAMVDAYLCEHPDVTASYSSCEAFFDDAAARTQAIPVYCGDLHMHAVGCYSVVRPLKQAVRKNEHGLGFTERCLRLAGDPRPDLSNLWKTVLFNEFHDILPGSCTADAARQALAELGGVEHSWRDLAYDALRRISSGMPVRCRQGEFRVFNSLPWPITVPIQIESFQYYREGAVFRDRAGQQIPIQESLAGARAFTRRWEFVDTVPAASARSYWFDDSSRREGDLDHRPHFVPGEEVATDTAGVSAGGGLWTRLDRGDSRCSWAPLEFAVLADESDTWGHRVRTYNDQVGVFERVLSSVQRGPVASRLRHRWEFGRSSIEAVYTVYTGLPGVRLDLTVNWHEFRRILKMRVRPEGAVADTLVMGGARGPIPRACDGLELPLHHWLVQECPSAQALLVQDGAFACDALAGTVSVTLVRSSVFAFHDPVKLDPQDPQDETDQGLHHFRFLFRGVDAHDPVEFDRAARTFVEPLWVVREGWSGTEGRD